MQIINTYDAIIKAFPDHVFVMDNWIKYISAINPELFEVCTGDAEKYDFAEQVLPVINYALSHPDKMEQLNRNFQAVVHTLTPQFPKLFDRDVPLDIILYLGLCNGAGWAVTMSGGDRTPHLHSGDVRDVILLGVEKIIELNWYNESDLQTLIFHELGHVWHRIYGNLSFPTETQAEKSLLQLYQEGIAMVCEHILCGNDDYYHQDKNGWLAWCRRHELEIKEEYFGRMKASLSTQDFFGDWCNYKGYSDVGYFLGCRFVTYMQKKYTLKEIVCLSCDVLMDEFECFVEDK